MSTPAAPAAAPPPAAVTSGLATATALAIGAAALCIHSPDVALPFVVGALAVVAAFALAAALRHDGLYRAGWALVAASTPLICLSGLHDGPPHADTTGSLTTVGLICSSLGLLLLALPERHSAFSASLQSCILATTGFAVLWRFTEATTVRWSEGPELQTSVLATTNVILVLSTVAHSALSTWARIAVNRLLFALFTAGMIFSAVGAVIDWRSRHVGGDLAGCLVFLAPGLVLVGLATAVAAARPGRVARRPALRSRDLYLLSLVTVGSVMVVGSGTDGLDPTLTRTVCSMVAFLVVSRLYEMRRARVATATAAEREHHLDLLVAESRDVILELDPHGRVMFASRAVEPVLGQRVDEVVAAPVATLVPELTPHALAGVPFQPGAATQPTLRVQSALSLGAGGVVHTEAIVSPLPAGYVVAIRDVTERVGLQYRLQQITYHDPATGLPNRASLEREVDHRLHEVASGDIALVLLDIEPDDLTREDGPGGALRATASVLRAATRAGDLVARVGERRFAVLLRAGTTSATAVAEATRVVDAVRAARLSPAGSVGARAGVCVATGTGTDVLRDAGLALRAAAEPAADRVQLFEAAMLDRHLRGRDLRRRLQRPPTDERWTLLYQPIVDLRAGSVSGTEALLRWIDPDADLIGIEEVVRLAEETGAIIGIGEWVLDRAVAQAARWADAGLVAGMNVNVSAVQLAADGFVAQVADTLARHGLDPGRLTLEITETAVLEHSEHTTRTLAALRALGVRIAIDDFGTGYAGLANVRAMPLDVLKIDRTFVQGLGDQGSDDAVVGAIAQLGRELGLTVTAEGVETPGQEGLVRALGVDSVQGYLYARPLTAHDATLLLGGPVA